MPVPSKLLSGNEPQLTTALRQNGCIQKRAGSKKNHRSPQGGGGGGGGGSGVAQVALGVSIEGNRGSRICAGRAVRRGHGEIS